MDLNIYYATNRAHEGDDRFQPARYGSRFSADGMENLRFGRVGFRADDDRVHELLAQERPNTGPGDGEALQDYFAGCIAKTQRIEAYAESIPDPTLNEAAQRKVQLGSKAMFAELQADMRAGRDVLVLIHGYNVSWEEAVGTAAALEAVLNRPDPAPRGDDDAAVAPTQPVRVVLFTWPSNGQALPFVSYKSDRSDAAGSAGAVGRALLKLRDFLHEAGREARSADRRVQRLREQLAAQGVRASEVERAVAQFESTELCGRNLHLLAHSMGNYVLQHALQRLWDFSPGSTLPRIFDRVFLCAADVDDDVLETRLRSITTRTTTRCASRTTRRPTPTGSASAAQRGRSCCTRRRCRWTAARSLPGSRSTATTPTAASRATSGSRCRAARPTTRRAR